MGRRRRQRRRHGGGVASTQIERVARVDTDYSGGGGDGPSDWPVMAGASGAPSPAARIREARRGRGGRRRGGGVTGQTWNDNRVNDATPEQRAAAAAMGDRVRELRGEQREARRGRRGRRRGRRGGPGTPAGAAGIDTGWTEANPSPLGGEQVPQGTTLEQIGGDLGGFSSLSFGGGIASIPEFGAGPNGLLEDEIGPPMPSSSGSQSTLIVVALVAAFLLLR